MRRANGDLKNGDSPNAQDHDGDGAHPARYGVFLFGVSLSLLHLLSCLFQPKIAFFTVN